MELTEELCEVIGAFIGDGCLHNSKNCHYHIQFAGHADLDINYYRKTICPIIIKYFQAKPSYKKVKGTNAIRICFYSKKFYTFLKGFLQMKENKKTYTIRIPNILFEDRNKHNLLAVIRGLFDTDGGVGFDRRSIYHNPYIRINYTSASRKLILQVYESLNVLGINPTIYKKGISSMIQINGSKNTETFMSKIGFSNERHLIKISQIPS